MSKPDGYSEHYSEQGFWAKLADFALSAGREVVYKALCMFFALSDSKTPAWAKSVIVAALGYFISPLDVIPDVMPIIGFTDDLGVLTAALTAVAAHISSTHCQRAEDTLKRWFPGAGA